MRIFSRFHSAQEHEEFVEGLLEAKRLRKRIEQLQHYRRMGIRTIAEAGLYEAEREKQYSTATSTASSSVFSNTSMRQPVNPADL